MNVILTGFMGTGKTAVGKRLAKRLGWRFVDVDELIEAHAKMPVARIFAERGELVFRRLERRYVSRVARGEEQVIATGGGAFVDPQNRARLRAGGVTVCLTAKPCVILERIGKRLALRPLLQGGDPLERIQALLAQRARAYAAADLTIDTTHRSVEEVVEQLWAQLRPSPCKSWQYLLDHTGKLAHRYGGKYVVVVDNHIVSSGETHLAAYQQARLKDTGEAGIYYIPLPEESLTALAAVSA